jgi:hypothetical protein
MASSRHYSDIQFEKFRENTKKLDQNNGSPADIATENPQLQNGGGS